MDQPLSQGLRGKRPWARGCSMDRVPHRNFYFVTLLVFLAKQFLIIRFQICAVPGKNFFANTTRISLLIHGIEQYEQEFNSRNFQSLLTLFRTFPECALAQFFSHSRPQSLRSFWPAAGIESSGSNHFGHAP